MHFFFIESNNVTGTFPSEMYSLLQLEDLRLFDNNLHGTIPFDINRLPIKFFYGK